MLATCLKLSSNVIMDCQEMHVVITQSFLPMIAALVAYSQDSHATIGLMLKAIKMLQEQVAVLQKSIKETGSGLDDEHKPPAKSGSLPPSIPSSATPVHEEPPWKSKTPPNDPTETRTFIGKTWYFCTKCLVTSSWVSMHQMSIHTDTHGATKLKALKHHDSHCFQHLPSKCPELLSLLDTKPSASWIPKKPRANIAAAKAETLDDVKAILNLTKSFPWSGLVNGMAIMSVVGEYSMDLDPFIILLKTKK